MPEFQRLEIQHFFQVYKALEPGKWCTPSVGDRGRRVEIEACRKRFAETAEHGEPGEHGGAAGAGATGAEVT